MNENEYTVVVARFVHSYIRNYHVFHKKCHDACVAQRGALVDLFCDGCDSCKRLLCDSLYVGRKEKGRPYESKVIKKKTASVAETVFFYGKMV